MELSRVLGDSLTTIQLLQVAYCTALGVVAAHARLFAMVLGEACNRLQDRERQRRDLRAGRGMMMDAEWRDHLDEVAATRIAADAAAKAALHIYRGETGPREFVYSAWSTMGQVERLTSEFRSELAERHQARATEIERRARAARSMGERPHSYRWGAWCGGGTLAPWLRLPLGAATTVVAHSELSQHVHDLESAARWHRGRAEGQRSRFETVSRCGDGWLTTTCKACGIVGEALIGCTVDRLCTACRDRAAQERRAIMFRARAHVLDGLHQLGMMATRRAGGRWSEKAFELTIPHHLVASHLDSTATIVRRRIEVTLAAWKPFSSSFRRYVHKKAHAEPSSPGRLNAEMRRALLRADGTVRTCWHRAFEWTPGADGLGHPHLHVWMIGPFIPEKLLREWWAAALSKVLGIDDEFFVISPNLREVKTESYIHETIKGGRRYRSQRLRLVDVGAEGGRPHSFNYVEGWAVDYGKHGDKPANAYTQAIVYKALEGRRTVQASANFLALGARSIACSSCGAVAYFNVDTCMIEPIRDIEVTTWKNPRWEPRTRAAPPMPGLATVQLELAVGGRYDVA